MELRRDGNHEHVMHQICISAVKKKKERKKKRKRDFLFRCSFLKVNFVEIPLIDLQFIFNLPMMCACRVPHVLFCIPRIASQFHHAASLFAAASSLRLRHILSVLSLKRLNVSDIKISLRLFQQKLGHTAEFKPVGRADEFYRICPCLLI